MRGIAKASSIFVGLTIAALVVVDVAHPFPEEFLRNTNTNPDDLEKGGRRNLHGAAHPFFPEYDLRNSNDPDDDSEEEERSIRQVIESFSSLLLRRNNNNNNNYLEEPGPVLSTLLDWLYAFGQGPWFPEEEPWDEDEELGVGYVSKTAAEKLSAMMDLLRQNEGSTTAKYPDTYLEYAMVSFFDDLSLSVNHYSDLSPFRRSKRIHSQGLVCSAKFNTVSDNNPYTGLFQTGTPYVLLRVGPGAMLQPTVNTPGVGVKLFRDGCDSANFVAMNTSEGIPEMNIFEPELTNHFARPRKLHLQLSQLNFDRASSPSTRVGLSDIASKTLQCEQIDDPKFPFNIILVPNPNLREQFNNVQYSPDLYYTTLSQIPSGTKLWDVFANDSPTSSSTSDDRIRIGEFVTTSDFFFSENVDYKFFIRHQEFEDDLKLRPDWRDAIEYIMGTTTRRRNLMAGGGCPMMMMPRLV